MSGGTYLTISSLRSERMSRKERVSVPGVDSSSDRHLMKQTSDVGLRTSSSTPIQDPIRCRETFDRPRSEARRPLLHSRHLHPSQLAGKARLDDLLEHFSHLGVLAQQVVDFLHAGARAPGDTFAPAAVHDFVVEALVLRHRINDCFHPAELFFVDLVSVLLYPGKGTDAGQHAHQVLD